MTSPRLRVVVVHGGAVARARGDVERALSRAPTIEVVASTTAASADTRCALLRPDAIVLDVVDLEVSLDFVEAIMTRTPSPILAIVADAAVGAALLDAGVVDALDSVADEARLERAVRVVSRIPVVTRRRARHTARVHDPLDAPPRDAQAAPVVAIGASTGGPAAVAEILAGLPPSFPLPVLVVVHIGPHFGYSFADWLGQSARLPVHQATDGARVLEGHVYVAPPERHMVLRGEHLFLTLEPERHSCRPSVDRLFESVAIERGPSSIGCLLTGIGRDGAAGLLAMRARGAMTIAQDEASCAVFGMPREAIAIGAAERVAAPAQIVSLLTAGAARLSSARLRGASEGEL